MSEQLALLPEYLTAHLQLTLVALVLGVALSVPLGVVLTRLRWIEQPVLGCASVIQTIPSLALLAIMVPTLAALNLKSIGYLPAIIGLTLYSILPILRNTVAGLTSVDPSLIEAARGVGMTPAQQLRRVELPVAMPVIVAGIRTSTVWTVGIATLATPVGATSLGNYIFTGLQTRNFTAVMVGCVAASILALLLDGLVRALEVAVQKRNRALAVSALGIFGLLCLFAGASIARNLLSQSRERITIGAKTFTEQYILSEILGRSIHKATGLDTTVMQSLGSTVAFDALRTGELDVYVDYSGTIWATIMKRERVPDDRSEVLQRVARYLDDEHGILQVGALGFENAYALAMRESHAAELGIRRISDLTISAPKLSMGGDYEFFGRPEWGDIRDAYGLKFGSRRSMDSSLMYQAAANGSVDVISAFSTDGRIAALGLRVLQDDRGAIPPYDAVILVSPNLRRKHPDVVETLRRLVGTIDADHMRRMNLAVDDQGRSPADVAAEFLGEGS
ncbi:MAG: glycine betaine ABC transporter substrate-binding protein [Candidatus Binatia bacterium]|nr:glycine betaine ABC transporter substrate-binding protein [Candidatus Binatia bacterium]